MKCVTFSLQRGYSGREVSAIISSAFWMGCGYQWVDAANSGTIPVGTVEFCEPLFGQHRRDFFPEFLRHLLHRTVLRVPGNTGTLRDWFVKDAEKWKSETPTQLVKAGTMLPPGNWWISEPVTFAQEWRYYVADGSIVTTGWYAGNDEDEPAPGLAVKWPKGFSGAVDFGRLDDGRLALVECHAPFACGWYGEDHRDYTLWQAIAWEKRAWWLSPKTR